MNIGVIGGGSIGLFVSASLHSAHDITIYVRRKEQKEKINNHGLFLSHRTKSLPVKSLLTEEIKEEDCFIICVKQTHVSSVLSMLSRVNKHTPLIFLQNGMGHIDLIKNRPQPIFLGVTEHGALRMDSTTVQHTGRGRIKLAAFTNHQQLLDGLTSKLNQPDFPVEVAGNWYQLLTEKLLINAVINPLTALFNVRNGDLLRNTYLNKLAKELCKEAASVLDADFWGQWLRVEEIAASTAENSSSMLKDITECQKTEIEAISGYLIRNTDKPLPYTSFIYRSIQALEMKKGIKK